MRQLIEMFDGHDRPWQMSYKEVRLPSYAGHVNAAKIAEDRIVWKVEDVV